MKTLKERLDDLNKRLKEAKTLEEAQKISQEIGDIIADAEKVASALEKANKEAKEHREAKEKLETENSDLKTKLEKETKDRGEDKDKDKDKPDPDEPPVWFKKYQEDIESIKKKDETGKQEALVKSKIEKALDDSGFPKTLAKFFHVKEIEKIDDEVSTFVQDLKNEELKDVIIPKKSDDGGKVGSEAIKEYAKSKNEAGSSSGITGKTLEI